eukprot:282641-Pyramimonas_sp.AAC.1
MSILAHATALQEKEGSVAKKCRNAGVSTQTQPGPSTGIRGSTDGTVKRLLASMMKQVVKHTHGTFAMSRRRSWTRLGQRESAPRRGRLRGRGQNRYAVTAPVSDSVAAPPGPCKECVL